MIQNADIQPIEYYVVYVMICHTKMGYSIHFIHIKVSSTFKGDHENYAADENLASIPGRKDVPECMHHLSTNTLSRLVSFASHQDRTKKTRIK